MGKTKEENNKRYYEENRERFLAYQAEYRRTHREKNKAYAKKWREDPANKETIKRYRDAHQKRRNANPEKRIEYEKTYRKKAIANGTSVQGWLIKKYSGRPCMDCDGVFAWIAMDFDHRPDETKEFNIGRLGQYKATPERIAITEKEIAKCDLVCSNCHRVRTQERNN